MLTESNPYRPIYEIYAVGAWAVAGAHSAWMITSTNLPSTPFKGVLGLSVVAILVLALRARRVARHRYALYGKPIALSSAEELQRKMVGHEREIWLGWGFKWEREHMQRLYDLTKNDVKPLWLPARWRPDGPKKYNPFLHGVEAKERDIYVPVEHFEGHTFVPATTGAIKTRLLALVAAQAIHRTPRETVIVIDPKGDRALQEILRQACAAAGREDDFAFFHPAFPSQSIRIDPLRNWSRTTELASRIAALMPSESGNDPFSAFGWRVVNLIADGLIYVGERPTIRSIRRYVEGGFDGLVHRTLEHYFTEREYDWMAAIERRQAAGIRTRRIEGVEPEILESIALYRTEFQTSDSEGIVDGLLSMFEHNREHAQKMIASLYPVLTMLTAGELDELLSPNRSKEDPRPVLDGARMIDSGGVYYIGLDSLVDSVVGSAIGSILLSDLTAAAGARFNAQVVEPKVNLFADEANESINPPFIQLLNKARGAGFSIMFFSQTVPDFIAKLGNEAMARQVLGNANSRAAGRIMDADTSEYVTESFGKSVLRIERSSHATSHGAKEGDLLGFAGSYGTQTTEEQVELVPPEALLNLPDLEYFANFGGTLYKGRIPVITY